MVEAKSSSKEVISNNNFFHPLDPLSFDEINKTTKIVKNNANLGKELLFETIMLIFRLLSAIFIQFSEPLFLS